MRFVTNGPFQFGRSNFVGLGRPLVAPQLGKMSDDVAWFEANRVLIAQQFAGQWVVVKDKAVVGAYPDFQSAYAAGIAMFGAEGFLVKEAIAEATSIRMTDPR